MQESWKLSSINIYNMLTCYMSSPPFQKIHLCSGTVSLISTIKACLLQWPFFSQHAPVVVMQQSGYSIFYNRDTLI